MNCAHWVGATVCAALYAFLCALFITWKFGYMHFLDLIKEHGIFRTPFYVLLSYLEYAPVELCSVVFLCWFLAYDARGIAISVRVGNKLI